MSPAVARRILEVDRQNRMKLCSEEIAAVPQEARLPTGGRAHALPDGRVVARVQVVGRDRLWVTQHKAGSLARGCPATWRCWREVGPTWAWRSSGWAALAWPVCRSSSRLWRETQAAGDTAIIAAPGAGFRIALVCAMMQNGKRGGDDDDPGGQRVVFCGAGPTPGRRRGARVAAVSGEDADGKHRTGDEPERRERLRYSIDYFPGGSLMVWYAWLLLGLLLWRWPATGTRCGAGTRAISTQVKKSAAVLAKGAVLAEGAIDATNVRIG